MSSMPAPHRVTCEALRVGHHHLRCTRAEGTTETLDLRRSGTTLRRGVGLVAHEHGVLREGLSTHARQLNGLPNQRVHLSSNVIRRQSGAVECGIREA